MTTPLNLGDGYLRISSRAAVRHSRVPTVPGSLVFVDLDLPPHGVPEVPGDAALLAKRVIEAPPGFFLHARHVMVRWPLTNGARPDSDDLQEHARAVEALIATRAAGPLDVGIVTFPYATEPWVTWAKAPQFDEQHLLARARTVELLQLLEWGRAIWAPSTYHYQLPSGEHSSLFVRVADGFRSPRDATVAATWLHRHLMVALGVVIDSATILPVVIALQHAAFNGGFGEFSVVALNDYPATRFEVDRAVDTVSASEHILGLLSVTSTGTTGRHVADAIERTRRHFAIEILVDRSGPRPVTIGRAGDGDVLPLWVGLGGIRESYATADECDICRDTTRARVVYVDPRSFEPLVLPRPDLLMPAVAEAQDNKQIWEFYDQVDGIGIQARPHPTTLDFRGNRERLAVRFFPTWLLDRDRYADVGMHDRFLDQVRMRSSRHASELVRQQRTIPQDERFNPAACDLVVTTADDAATKGFAALLEALSDGLGCPSLAHRVVTSREGVPRELSEEAKAAIVASHHVLVLTVGALTGTTMQQLLVAVHDAMADTGRSAPQLAGLIVHARPEDSREWEVLANAYSGRLVPLWLTFLPLTSPFDDELDVLNSASLGANDDAAKWLRLRLEFFAADPEWGNRIANVDAATVDPWSVFWGMPLQPVSGLPVSREHPRLRPGSRFGQRARSVTTFAAVGSAMQHARLRARPKGAPSWQQFELPAILRSYFDPPIVAAILRWLHAHEAWWGDRDEDAANVLAEALARSSGDDLKILLPELLLAAAQGKVPRSGVELLKSEVDTLLDCGRQGVPVRDGEEAWSDAEIAPLDAALQALGEGGGALNEALSEVAASTMAIHERLSALAERAPPAVYARDVAGNAARAVAHVRRDLKTFLRSLRRLGRDLGHFESEIDRLNE
jgi:hypothetical protein